MKLETIILGLTLALSGCSGKADGEKCGEGRYYDSNTEQCEWVSDEDNIDSSEGLEDCVFPDCFKDNFNDFQYTEDHWNTIGWIGESSYSVNSGVLYLKDQIMFVSLPEQVEDSVYISIRFKTNSPESSFQAGIEGEKMGEFEGITVEDEKMNFLILLEDIEEYIPQGWNSAEIYLSGIDETIILNLNGQEKFNNSNNNPIMNIELTYQGVGFKCSGSCQVDYFHYEREF